MTVLKLPTRRDLREAASRIAPYAHRTPHMSSRAIDALVGAEIVFKCENLQRAGAFKFRGACNAVLSLDEASATRGVITHSSGNHAGALALAAQIRGIEACIVMPEDASRVKIAAVRAYGARIEFCASTQAAREATVARLQQEHPRTLVHPYDDPRVIAGQGTAALELLQEFSDLDILIAPVGGGGLLAGTALAAGTAPATAVYGAEPLAADDAKRSLAAGHIIAVDRPTTIADGLRTCVGEHNFAIMRQHVRDILTVSEAAIVAAMRLIWERMKLVVEPSGAVPLAALLEHGPPPGAKRIGAILSGGNIDLNSLPWSAADEA
ncbi:MAG: pyridoxal-phosphate dependent enzyme [Gammaproteobacteria bacterium]|nr:pyridoxal-phosphate dependent enzyme [Gammaproteobacteria bacterium]